MLKIVALFLVCLGFTFGDINCPANYNLFDDGYCYQLLSTPVHRNEGKQRCEAEGGVLPKISDPLQNAIVTKLSSDASVVTWLGLTCSDNSKTDCIWDDGSSMTFDNFDAGSPDINGGYCVYINVAAGKEGKWTSASCPADFKAVICQKSLNQPNITCPDSYIKGSDDRCYFQANIKLPFNNAEAVCTATSSDTNLVSITSDDENGAIQLISQAAHFTDIFIGLQLGANGYAWIDGSDHIYDNFEDRQPNPRAGNCVAMNVITGKWRSVPCDQSMSFVCLKKYTLYPVSSSVRPPPPPSSTTTATNTGSSCPSDNTFYGPSAVDSPNYPNYYGSSLECEYHLYVATGNLVSVRFIEFYLKNTDYIDLYDGDSDSTLLYRLHGSVSSDQFFTTKNSNKMLVRFVSTAGFANVSGWVLFFKAQQYGITSTPSTSITTRRTTTYQPDNTYYGSGTITSPNYPSLYPNNLNATYILEATPGKIVQVTFNRINTERCCDTITIYDGIYEDQNKVITTLSGDHSTALTYQSNGTYMTIRFLTDPVLQEEGFTADFISYGSGTTPPKNCEDGWTHDPSQQYCYKYFQNGGPWSQNYISCNNLGAKLLTIHNAQQETYIETFIYNAQLGGQSSKVWMGLHYQFDDWGWSDGTSLDSYKDWPIGEPSTAGDCAAISTLNNNKKGWVVTDCNTVLPYVCYHDASN